MKSVCRLITLLALVAVLSWTPSYATEPTRTISTFIPIKNTSGELLRRAAFEGNLAEMERLLARGVKVDDEDEDGWTPLIWAQLGNQAETARLLLRCGAQIDVQDRAGYTAVHQAAMAGRDEVLEMLRKHGARVDTVSRSGYTPLMDAAAYGRAVEIELLLARGADPNAMTKDGYTALSFAERHGQRHVALLLMANGADPNIQHKRLQAALAKMGFGSMGPTRVHLAGHLRNPDVLERLRHSHGSPGSCEGFKLVAGELRGLGAARRIGDGSLNHNVQEALEIWEQLQVKYPYIQQRFRYWSEKAVSMDTLCAKEPLLRKALGLWQRIQCEHPDLAAHVLTLAGIVRR